MECGKNILASPTQSRLIKCVLYHKRIWIGSCFELLSVQYVGEEPTLCKKFADFVKVLCFESIGSPSLLCFC